MERKFYGILSGGFALAGMFLALIYVQLKVDMTLVVASFEAAALVFSVMYHAESNKQTGQKHF